MQTNSKSCQSLESRAQRTEGSHFKQVTTPFDLQVSLSWDWLQTFHWTRRKPFGFIRLKVLSFMSISLLASFFFVLRPWLCMHRQKGGEKNHFNLEWIKAHRVSQRNLPGSTWIHNVKGSGWTGHIESKLAPQSVTWAQYLHYLAKTLTGPHLEWVESLKIPCCCSDIMLFKVNPFDVFHNSK